MPKPFPCSDTDPGCVLLCRLFFVRKLAQVFRNPFFVFFRVFFRGQVGRARIVLIQNFERRDKPGQAGKAKTAFNAGGVEIALDRILSGLIQVGGNFTHVARVPITDAGVLARQFPQFGSQFVGFVTELFLIRTGLGEGFIVLFFSFAVPGLPPFAIVGLTSFSARRD